MPQHDEARPATAALLTLPRRRMVERPDWFPDWSGQTAVLVASGPSAKSVNLELARGRARVLVINESWRLAPWAEVLYVCDEQYWLEHRGVPAFTGLKITQDRRALKSFPELRHVTTDRSADVLLVKNAGVIGWGGNSGFQAINLACQFGASKIVLVGYDMTLSHGSHWHGDHKGRCTNPSTRNVDRWRFVTDRAAEQLKALGVEAVNVSSISTLKAYPRADFEDAIEWPKSP